MPTTEFVELDVTVAFGYLMKKLDTVLLKTANDCLKMCEKTPKGAFAKISFDTSPMDKSEAYTYMNLLGFMLYKGGHNMKYEIDFKRLDGGDTKIGNVKSGEECRKYKATYNIILMPGLGLKTPAEQASEEKSTPPTNGNVLSTEQGTVSSLPEQLPSGTNEEPRTP